MKKMTPAADPDAYVAALDGWRFELVTFLRDGVRRAGPSLEEVIKWGHLVYFCNGPVLLIRAEEQRVLFGFWRGKRLVEFEPRLKPGGKYELATMDMRQGAQIDAATVRRLVKQAIDLNRRQGNPQDAAAKRPAAKKSGKESTAGKAMMKKTSATLKSKKKAKTKRRATRQAKKPAGSRARHVGQDSVWTTE